MMTIRRVVLLLAIPCVLIGCTSPGTTVNHPILQRATVNNLVSGWSNSMNQWRAQQQAQLQAAQMQAARSAYINHLLGR